MKQQNAELSPCMTWAELMEAQTPLQCTGNTVFSCIGACSAFVISGGVQGQAQRLTS